MKEITLSLSDLLSFYEPIFLSVFQIKYKVKECAKINHSFLINAIV